MIMAQGLQVFNGEGTCTFDSTNRYARIIGTRTLVGDGTISADSLGLGNVKIWYIILQPCINTIPTRENPIIRITGDGKTIKWNNLSDSALILLGVY